MAEEIPTQLYAVTAEVIVHVREESPEAAGDAIAVGWAHHDLPHCQSVEWVAVSEVRKLPDSDG